MLGLETIFTSLISAVVGGTVVAIITHALTIKREREQKKREFILKFLVEAWQNIEAGSREQTDIHRKSEVLEKAIADIQLFGSATQIAMADKWAKEMVSKNSSDSTVLLNDLRDDLRRELGLPDPARKLFFFRLTPKFPRDASKEQLEQ
jgi:hypothetical protein